MANTSWMKARQTKFAAYTAVYVIIVVAVVSVLNFLANRYNKSYDTTANKQFTLSDQTLKVVRKHLNAGLGIRPIARLTGISPARVLQERDQMLSEQQIDTLAA